MKIGIMGTHGVGKTTFALNLVNDFIQHCPDDNVGLVDGIARQCPFPINENVSEEAQRWIFHRQMMSEIEMLAESEILICGRTVLDSLAYSYRAGFGDIVSAYMGAAIDWMKSYDEIYWVRPDGHKLVNDGARSLDLNFQTEIDQIFADWIRIWGLSVIKYSWREK